MNGEDPSESVLHELAEAKAACQRALEDAERQRRLREELEDAVRSRDAILSVVAHDLRNPLNVISLAANSLLLGLADASARRSLERIIRSAQRADRMIRDLHTVSAIETGRFTMDKQPVETAEPPQAETIEEIGLQVEKALQGVPGTRSAFFERVTGGYYIDYQVRREEAAPERCSGQSDRPGRRRGRDGHHDRGGP